VESEEESCYAPGISIPLEEESEEPTESLVVITEEPTETPEETTESADPDKENTDQKGSTGNKENTGNKGSAGEKGNNGQKGSTGNKNNSGNKESTGTKTGAGSTGSTGTTAGSTGSATGSTSSDSSNTGSDSSSTGGDTSSNDSSSDDDTDSTEEATLDSVLLTASVTNPLAITKGETATLSWTAKDSDGNDVTDQSTAEFITTNCTVNGSTVSFMEAGTATIRVSVTYNGITKTSSKLSYQVNEPVVVIPVLTTVTLGDLESTYNQGGSVTLSATAEDQNGNELSSVTFAYIVTGATLDEETNTVTFDQWGEVTITVTGTQDDTTVSSEAVTITVLPVVGDTVLSQKISDQVFGSSYYLPEAAATDADQENTNGEPTEEESTDPVTYQLKDEAENVVLTATLSGADRAEDDTATLEEAMKAAMATLNVSEENATLNEEKGYYELTYTDGDTTVLVRCYLGEKASNTLTITYAEGQETLAKGILETFQPGDLTTTHETTTEKN
jgi:hypothetical protein